MIKKRDIDDLDEDLWLLESKVRSLRFALIMLGIFVEAALFMSVFALYSATGVSFW